MKFKCFIDQNSPTDFYNRFQLLAHLRNELLQICDHCRSYEFLIFSYSKKNVAVVGDIIFSILQMPEIQRCSSLKFSFHLFKRAVARLPAEAIKNWLVRIADGNDQAEYRFLQIKTHGITNRREICDRLKQVWLKIRNRQIFFIYLI